MSLFWLWLYAYGILYNMSLMWWCSILLLLIACFITFVEHCNKNNHNINVLFMLCIADLCQVKIVDKFQSEIRISNVCKSNSNWNFIAEFRKFELHLTFIVMSLPAGVSDGGEMHWWRLGLVLHVKHWLVTLGATDHQILASKSSWVTIAD